MAAFLTCSTFSPPAFGCMCFPTPMCSDISTLSPLRAVFVGRVVDIWPSREVYASESQSHLSFAQLRKLILNRWGSVLSEEQKQYVRVSPDRDKIEYRFAYLQRVRFVVAEVFAGPAIHEIYTDASSCGYRFESGKDYLVNSVRNGSLYSTGACSRTGRLESDEAVQDLKALHARKSGSLLPPRIYGRIPSEYLRPDTRIHLINEHGEKSVRIGMDGSFSFNGLEKAKYRLHVEDGRGEGEREIDLSRLGRCFEATPWFSDSWRIGGTPVVIDAPPAELPEPPMLLARP
jgi:hypothetical protein